MKKEKPFELLDQPEEAKHEPSSVFQEPFIENPQMRGTLGGYVVEAEDDEGMRCFICQKFLGDKDFSNDNVIYTESCCHMFHKDCLQRQIMA